MTRRKSSPQRAAERLRKKQRNDIKLDKKIIALQNVDIPLIPKLPFSRLVREIMQEYKENYRVTATALVVFYEMNFI